MAGEGLIGRGLSRFSDYLKDRTLYSMKDVTSILPEDSPMRKLANRPDAPPPAAKVTPQAATAVAGLRVSANQTVPNGFRPVTDSDPNRRAYPSYQYFNPKVAQVAEAPAAGAMTAYNLSTKPNRFDGAVLGVDRVPEAKVNNLTMSETPAPQTPVTGEVADPGRGYALVGGRRIEYQDIGVKGKDPLSNRGGIVYSTSGPVYDDPNVGLADREYEAQVRRAQDIQDTLDLSGKGIVPPDVARFRIEQRRLERKDTLNREELYKYKIPNMEMDSADRRATLAASTGLGYANLDLGYKRLAQDSRLEGIRMNNETKLKIAEMKGSDGGNKLLEKVIAANAGDPMALSTSLENLKHVQRGDVYTPPKKGGLFGFGKKEAYWSPPGMKPTGKMTPDGKQIYTGANGKQYIE